MGLYDDRLYKSINQPFGFRSEKCIRIFDKNEISEREVVVMALHLPIWVF